MGIMANVEILRSKVRVQFPAIEDVIRDLEWRTEPFTPVERDKVKQYLEKNLVMEQASMRLTHEGYSVWALIWWEKENK
jgi:hypothetical protein